MELINCNEYDGKEKIRVLRRLATENGVNRRIDDEFLKRFLMGHGNDIPTALKAISTYESFVNRRSDTWLKFSKSRLDLLLNSHVIDILDKTGINNQKVIWIRLENWDPSLFSADEILEVSGLLCQLAYVNKEYIRYLDIIIDLQNFSLKHLYALSPKFAKRMIFFISECLPMKLANIYVIRQPKLFYLLYAVFKPFIEERMRKLIYICSYNFKALIDHIGMDILPCELDGNGDLLYPRRWLVLLQKPKVIKDLKLSGYEFYASTIIRELNFY